MNQGALIVSSRSVKECIYSISGYGNTIGSRYKYGV